MQKLSLPFYAWECITIIHKNRDLDLVIRDEHELRVLLEFLIIRLNTFNGVKDSFKILKNKRIVKQEQSVVDMLPWIYKSYSWMKFRMKITFEASRANKTLQEHFLTTILHTYKQRVRRKLVKDPYPRVTTKMILAVRKACLASIHEATATDHSGHNHEGAAHEHH